MIENYPEVHFVRQETQLGTGHAVKIAEKSLPQNEALLLILYGDTPFVNAKTINKMVEEKNNGANIVVLGFKEEKPNSYGKLIQSQIGYLQKIGPSLCFEAVITIFANSASSLGAITTTFGKQQRYAKSKDPA